MQENKYHISESVQIAFLLAFAGGFLDAYTYVARGEVFANAQTGNIVLLGIHLLDGRLGEAVHYLVPILSFVMGILVAETVKKYFLEAKKLHWRQIILGIEIATLVIAAFVPESGNPFVNAAISFVSSLQVQSFRKVRGNPFTTTMCTGNLRMATEHLYAYSQSREKRILRTSLLYYAVIGCFLSGAGVGAFLTRTFRMQAVLFPAGILLIAMIVIMADRFLSRS